MSYQAHGDVKEFFAVAAEALRYLVNRIRTLKEDDDIIIVRDKKELVLEDLEEAAVHIEGIAKQFDKIYSTPRNPNRVEAEWQNEDRIIQENREVVCRAFTLYYNDLQESKTKILKRLGLGLNTTDSTSNMNNNGNSSFVLQRLDNSIETVKRYKESFCDSRGKSTARF